MKTIIFTFTMLSFCCLGQSQITTVDAFSASYTHESASQYDKAIADLKNLGSPDYSINLRLGWLYYLQGDYIQSQSHYEQAIEQEKQSIEARLGYAYPTSAIENWNDVEEKYQEILNINPMHAVTNYRMAYINYYIKKDNEIAINYLNKVLSIYPFDFDSNLLWATIALSQGKIKEAKIAVLTALQYDPTSKEALNLYDSIK